MIEILPVDEGLLDDGTATAQSDVRFAQPTNSTGALEYPLTVNPLLAVVLGQNQIEVNAVLSDIADRYRAGASTPVLVGHVDDLQLRDVLLALALEAYP
jgi:hypothetical protein